MDLSQNDQDPFTHDHAFLAFEQRYATVLNNSLGWEMFTSLARAGNKTVLIDRSQNRQAFSAHLLLALALEFSRKLEREVKTTRVGIVLPPGIGGWIANLACFLIGKTPVNLNFTLPPNAVSACIDKAEIQTLVTASAMQERLPDFPWGENVIDIASTLKALPKWKIARWLLTLKTIPAAWIAHRLSVPREGGTREATILFTSGSVGSPKAVVLTHRNVLGNIYQITDYDVLHPDDSLLGCLPIFHSFGFTVTLCFTLARGMKVVTLPSPLETGKIAHAIEEEKVTVHIGTPTLLRPYFKKVKPEQLSSLRAVVAGAEKTPPGFHDRWQNAFGSQYLEGYGLTETTPVVACNIPGKGTRTGSVGKLFPGMQARIYHPDTLTPQPLNEVGLLALRGINVFQGYLEDDTANQACMREGWFITGDLARLDSDGFLYIEGRRSRFSKIAGEMVPHGTVESAILKALGKEDAETLPLAIAARPDEAKGEALVILTTFELDAQELKTRLEAAGNPIPNLWIPRIIRQVEAIPMLGSGKLDLKALAVLANETKSLKDMGNAIIAVF